MASGSGVLDEGDRGSVVIIVAYTWVAISVVVSIIRFGLAWRQRQRFKLEDATFLLGVALAIMSSVCLHMSVRHGLGEHITTVSESRLGSMYKADYAAELVGITAMGLAKTSVILFCDRIATARARSFYIVLSAVSAWYIFALFATAFQCPLPQPWVVKTSTCASHMRLQCPIIAFNILTDVMIALWILPTLSTWLVDSSKRGGVFFLFGARLLVCASATIQLIIVIKHDEDEDVTFTEFGRLLFELCVVYLSVLLGAVPRSDRFITTLQSIPTRLTGFERSTSHEGSFQLTEYVEGKGAIAEPSLVHKRERSTSASVRSKRSKEPLVDLPLTLTPSLERTFNTQITSTPSHHNLRGQAAEHSKKHEEGNERSMFSWTSSATYDQRIIQTKEVTQEVEVIVPRESKWALPRPRTPSRAL